MNRKQKRLQVIQYFLRISQAQQEIQNIQNQLISHVRFNPLMLFKKIAQGSNVLTQSQLREFIEQQTGIKDRGLLNIYFMKHHLQGQIKLTEFTASILSYTPNILREVNDKIVKQMETKHIDKTVEELYTKMIETELQHIFQICMVQTQLELGWTQLNRLIQKDLSENGRKVDLQVEQTCGMVNIRKWLELWIQIEEYKILNIMRWCGGYQEPYLKLMYQSGQIKMKCTCNNSSHHRLSFERHSQCKQTSINYSQSVHKIKKVKSETNIVHHPNHYLKMFITYVETIIKSERRLQLLRENIRPYKKEVQLILHQITSKKYNHTKISKIITQTQKILQLKPQLIEQLLAQLQNSQIDNSFIFSLFATPPPKQKPQSRVSGSTLITEVYQVLYTFCLCKATLKSISKDLKIGIGLVFKQLDQKERGHLNKADLKQILTESNIHFKKQDLTILMNHFGDGQAITSRSMQEVINIQRTS